MSEFKKCPNGHYYNSALAQCPFCPSGRGNSAANDNTQVHNPVNVDASVPTQAVGGFENSEKTQVYGGFGDQTQRASSEFDVTTIGSGDTVGMKNPDSQNPNITQFIFEQTATNEKGEEVKQKTYRNTRRLVGWLVTYSFDNMGVDFKLYEGQNIIGRTDEKCSIIINDATISSKHATLLFRDGIFALRDEMSAHGTTVNGNALGFEAQLIKDGDMIRMGETTFMFRTSF